jgi:hypothetical protein
MKIPVTFLPDLKVFIVSSTLRAPRYHANIFGTVKFVIDTGSSASFIGQIQAVSLRVPLNKLELSEEKPGRGLSGGAILMYKMNDVTLTFPNLDISQTQKIQCNKFYVGVSASDKESTLINVNILGNDFLIDHKFKFIANPHGESYLESIEEKTKD